MNEQRVFVVLCLIALAAGLGLIALDVLEANR